MNIENNVLVQVTNNDIKDGTVVIPDSVEYIGVYAFAFCKQLKEIVIPDSVKSIGKGAFDGCKSLENIVLSDSVKMIGDYAFCCCSSLEEIALPNSIKYIGEYAFEDCSSLKEIILPDSVDHIEKSAFKYCTNLSKITYKSKDLNVKCIDGDCMVIKSSKNLDDYIICKTYYFDDYKNENLDIIYIAEKDGFTAHGKTLKQAIADVSFKILQDKDVSEHIMRVKSQGFVTPNDYRLITGACRQGTERFLTANNLTWDDKMEISKVCELVQNQYDGSKFIEAMR